MELFSFLWTFRNLSLENLSCSPLVLIGFAVLFPVTGFVAGRQATAHPIWASAVSALVASLGLLPLGIMTGETATAGASTVGGFERIFLLLAVAKLMFEMWIQQTFLLTGLSAAGGTFALFIKRRKEKASIGIGRSPTALPSHATVHTGPYTAIRLIKAKSAVSNPTDLPGFQD